MFQRNNKIGHCHLREELHGAKYNKLVKIVEVSNGLFDECKVSHGNSIVDFEESSKA